MRWPKPCSRHSNGRNRWGGQRLNIAAGGVIGRCLRSFQSDHSQDQLVARVRKRVLRIGQGLERLLGKLNGSQPGNLEIAQVHFVTRTPVLGEVQRANEQIPVPSKKCMRRQGERLAVVAGSQQYTLGDRLQQLDARNVWIVCRLCLYAIVHCSNMGH